MHQGKSSKLWLLALLLVITIGWSKSHRHECRRVSEKELKHCACYDDSLNPRRYSILFCHQLQSVEDLEYSIRKVKESGTRVGVLQINDTILPNLKGGLFKALPLRDLLLIHSKILILSTPKKDVFQGLEHSLEVFRMTENTFARNWNFTIFRPLKKLFSLEIVHGDILIVAKQQMDLLPQHLKFLSLQNNKINTIEENAFINLNLELIDLSFNVLTELPENAFPETIRFLAFSHNFIKSLPLTFLDELTELTALELSDNRIKALDQRSFEFLDLKTRPLSTINLSENPLDCCAFTWILNSQVQSRIDGTCKDPEEIRGKDVKVLYGFLKKICRQ